MKFNLIIGNPPFRIKNSGNHNLYLLFIKNALKTLKKGGHLFYVTGTSWMKPGDFFNDLNKNDIKYIETGKNLQDYFPGIGIKFSLLYIVNSTSKGKTEIVYTEKEKVVETTSNISKLKFLPWLMTKESMSILDKVCNHSENNKINLNYTQSRHVVNQKNKVSKTKTEQFKYEIDQSGTIWYTNEPQKHHNTKKIILSFWLNKLQNMYYDNGTRGTANNSNYIPVTSREEYDFYKKIFFSELYTFIFKITSSEGKINFHLWPHFSIPNVNELPINFNNVDIYSYFNISTEEIQLVEETIK
jgi:hypothetical protein